MGLGMSSDRFRPAACVGSIGHTPSDAVWHVGVTLLSASVYESQDADTSRFRDADEGCSDLPSEAGAAA